MSKSAWLFALLLAAAPLSAQTATLVKDINPSGPAGEDVASSSPRGLTAVGDKVFFFAFEPSSGTQVWVSDGTSAGTRELPVASVPEAGSSQILGSLRNLFLWTLNRSSVGVTIFRSDGTRAGTFELFPRDTGLDAYGPEEGAALLAGDHLYFLGCDPDAACTLWTSDGTVAGTHAVPGSPSFLQPSEARLTGVGNRVFFFGEGSLWISDGTAAGTHAVKALPEARRLTAAGNRLFFTSFTSGIEQLWTSDGTAAGTIPVSRFSQVAPFPDPPFFLPSGNGLFFSARDSHGVALWQSGGTPAGTRRLTDTTTALPPNGLNSSTLATANGRPLFLTSSDFNRSRLWTAQGGKAVALTTAQVTGSLFQGAGRVYFVASDGGHGFEPWVSDGTVAGTHLLKDLCRGTCNAEVHGFVAGGGATYFANGSDIWKTDGTEAGTQRITSPGFTPSFSGFEVAEAGGKLFVSSATPYGNELWMRDASGQDRVVTDIARGAPSSRPQELLRFGDRLFFTACDGTDRSLWQVTPAGDDATPLPGTARSCISASLDKIPWGLVTGNLLYFARKNDLFPSQPQLWRTDGTEAGTLQLTDLPNGILSGDDLNSGLQIRTVFQGKLLFATYRTIPGGVAVEEIWETDGTVAGTRKSPYIPDGFISVTFLRAVGNEIYFFAFESSTSAGLWRSDGTVAGTRKIAPLLAQSGADPQFVRLGNAVYFLASSAGSRRQLWHTDGTSAGTQPLLNVDGGPESSYLAELTLFEGSLFLMTGDPDHETLWRSDGTPAGTTAVKTFPYPLRGVLQPHGLTIAGGRLFFAQADDAHGAELWSTDGTPEGTALVKDIFPGPISSGPAGLTAAGGRLFFAAQDGAHGTELWESDGTAAGTHLVQDLAPEALSSSPGQLTVAGDRLFFTADDGQFGRELWSLPLTGAGGCQASSAHLCLNGGRYQVEAAWRDSQGNSGFGTAVPLSGDTGYFWFFDAANVEAVVKVLDGTGVNGHVWVFYGALSNVEYTLTVTDTQTGLTRRYFNPQGQLASIGDVYGFGPLGAYGANPAVAPPSPAPWIAERQSQAAAVPCVPDAQRLCLNGGRFGVEVAWKDFQGNTGKGTAVPLSGGTTGTFWFFNAANVELIVKALDGRDVNGHFWIFFGALSNVEYTVTVTDSQTGALRTYTNPSGRFASVADTAAF